MFHSIKEEFRRMLSSKQMIVLLFIIPFATNILLGFVFEGDQIQHIPMAVVDQDGSSLSRTIIKYFTESDTFSVKYVLDNESDLQKLIEEGKVRVGMIIPEHFSRDVTNLKSPSILMLYDGTYMSVASTAKAKASEILLTVKTGVSMKVIGGKLGVQSYTAGETARLIKFDSRFLYNPAKSYKNFLNPGLGVAIVQTVIVLLGAVCVKRESLQGDFLTKLGYVSGKIVFYTLIGWVSFIGSVLTQSIGFGIPFRGSIGSLLLLSFMMAAAIATFAVMVSVWVPDTSFATLTVAVLFIPNSALTGYSWPITSMPDIYQKIAYAMPFTHYAIPLRDLYLKGLPMSVVSTEVEWFCGFILVAFAAISVKLKLPELVVKRSEVEETKTTRKVSGEGVKDVY